MIRLYNHKTDFEEAARLLAREKVINIGLNKPASVCFVSELNNNIIGLFVISLYTKIPILQHFVVARHARNKTSEIGFVSKNTLELLRLFDFFIAKLKSNVFAINLSHDRLRVCRFVERYFNKRIEQIIRTKNKCIYIVRIKQWVTL